LLDPLAIPNAVTDMQIEEEQDYRNSFFSHVQLTVSWNSPKGRKTSHYR